jgi:hypothetical protein
MYVYMYTCTQRYNYVHILQNTTVVFLCKYTLLIIGLFMIDIKIPRKKQIPKKEYIFEGLESLGTGINHRMFITYALLDEFFMCFT